MTANIRKQTEPKNEEDLPIREQRIYNFLRENPVGVLSSVDPNGDPHGAAIYYSVNYQFVISFLTKSGTHKYDNIKRHNHVMLTVFEPESQTTAQILGKAIEIKDSSRVREVGSSIWGANFKTKGKWQSPLTKLDAGSYVAFDIVPAQIRMAAYGKSDSGKYADLFESIESSELYEQERSLDRLP